MFDASQHRMDVYGALAALVMFAVFLGTWWWYGMRLYRARELVQRGAARLIDVDTPEMFRTSPIEDACNIPVAQLDERMFELGSHRRPIVVCGHRSLDTMRATRRIRRYGYRVIDAGAWM
jgi:rhodanese-related sulfurtransferase